MRKPELITHAAPIQPPPIATDHDSVVRGPLSPEHMRALAEARVRAKKIRRAASVAMFSGWTMAFFAAVTLLGALFGDYASLVLGAALGAVACNELRGGSMIRRFEPRGARALGYNQFFLGAVIVSYAVWSLYAALRQPLLASAGGSTGDPKLDEMVRSLTALMTYGLYGSLFVIGIVAPALTAWYYFSRERLIRSMIEKTPQWVIEAMRATA